MPAEQNNYIVVRFYDVGPSKISWTSEVEKWDGYYLLQAIQNQNPSPFLSEWQVARQHIAPRPDIWFNHDSGRIYIGGERLVGFFIKV